MPKANINVAHQSSNYIDPTVALREHLDRLEGERTTSFDIIPVANTRGNGSTITAGILDAGSYRYNIAKNGVDTQDRTTLSQADTEAVKVYQPILAIDQLRETKKVGIDMNDVAAGYEGLRQVASTVVYNTPIVEMNKAAFKALAVGAKTANWTVGTQANYDALTSEEIYQAIAKQIVRFKSLKDEFQSNGIEDDSDLLIVMDYETLSKWKSALTTARTGSERQAAEFYKSLSDGYAINGVQVMITNHLASGTKWMTITRGIWGALGFKVAFQSAVEKTPGKINTFRAWSEYTYGMKVIFPDYISGYSIGAKPTK